MLARIPDILPNAGRSAEMTYYETPAGAKVFAAGALNFAASVDEPAVSRLLDNLWARLSLPVNGLLDVGDGHLDPLGGARDRKPALMVHGGPGAGCSPYHLDLFDLDGTVSSWSTSATAAAAGRTRATPPPT